MQLINLINEAQQLLDDENIAFFVSTWYFNMDINDLFLSQKMEINSEDEKNFLEIIQKCNNKPYQYVINDAEFLDMHLYVDERAFIPRVETEEVTINIIDEIKQWFSTEKLEMCDIGTGSGCIATGLGVHFPNSKVTAIELSEEAIEVAKKNFKKFTKNVTAINSKSLDYFLENNIKLDCIISNPPYIGLEDQDVEKVVMDNEPHVALFSSNYGLEIYEEILRDSLKVLNDHYLIGFEIGHNQGEEIKKLANKYLSNTKYTFKILKDLNENDRTVIITGDKYE